jgi:type IV pilus assembly protein PilO
MNFINFNEWPSKPVIFFGISFLIAALGYWFLIRTQCSNLKNLSAKEISLKAMFEKKQSQLYDLPALKKQLQEIQKRFASLLQQLPAKNQMPDLLEDISKTGIASGLKIRLFVPQPEIIHDFYVELPLKISLVGTYVQLALFISKIAEMNRMITLHEFSIQRAVLKDENPMLEEELVMHLTAKIYRYKAS